MGCQRHGTRLPGDILAASAADGQLSAASGVTFPQGTPPGLSSLLFSNLSLEACQAHTHGTSKSPAPPMTWPREPTSVWPRGSRAEPTAQRFPVTQPHTGSFWASPRPWMVLAVVPNTPCHPSSRGWHWGPASPCGSSLAEQSRELGLPRVKQPQLHLRLFLLCFSFSFPFPLPLSPSLPLQQERGLQLAEPLLLFFFLLWSQINLCC